MREEEHLQWESANNDDEMLTLGAWQRAPHENFTWLPMPPRYDWEPEIRATDIAFRRAERAARNTFLALAELAGVGLPQHHLFGDLPWDPEQLAMEEEDVESEEV